MSASTGENPSSAENRAALENEKLRAELRDLNKPWWKDVKQLGAAIAFVISVASNFLQYQQSQREEKRNDQKFSLESAKWSEEKEKLQAELSKVKSDEVFKTKRRAEIQALLKETKQYILHWDSRNLVVNEELIRLESMKDTYQSSPKNAEQLKATIEKIQLQKLAIAMGQSGLQHAKQRQEQLEQQLTLLTCE